MGRAGYPPRRSPVHNRRPSVHNRGLSGRNRGLSGRNRGPSVRNRRPSAAQCPACCLRPTTSACARPAKISAARPRRCQRCSRPTSVSNVASGGQAKRTGV
ncbi:hypothetical protein GCM10010377_46440 [Streptomyces viridiviolaceus]|nr:hypothetical protein GCM10010377_46440 [Streptomyces viridiviolaceus]